MSIQELRGKIAAKSKELSDLVSTDRAWDPVKDQPVYDALVQEVESIQSAIDRHNKSNELAAVNNGAGMILENAAQKAGKDSEPSSIYHKWLRGGDKALTNEDWSRVHNSMSTGVGEEGGFTVQTDVASTIVEGLKAYGGIREIANSFTTTSGNSMEYPTSDGTAEEGEIVGENVLVSDEDTSFGSVALPVYKFSSKVITVPIELLQDSNADIEAFVNNRIMERLARATSRTFVTGTGVNQPRGFVTASGVGHVTPTGRATTLVYDDFVELEHSVDPAYRNMGNCRFALHDSALKAVKKIKDEDGRPIFVPGYDVSTNNQAGEILGYSLTIIQEMDELAANSKSIAFGDFKKYMIRDALMVQMNRFTDSAYAKRGQVGFLAFARCGGNLIDVSGAIKVMQQAAS